MILLVQYLRAVSVMIVILYHFAPSMYPKGYLGVDIFFVISGFLIIPKVRSIMNESTSIQLRNNSLRQFYMKRFLRLIPSQVATIFGTTFLLFFFMPVNSHIIFYKQALSSQFLLGNLGATFFAGDYFNPARNLALHFWSLSVEEQFYLFLAPIIFYLCRTKKYMFRVLLLFVIAAILLFLHIKFLGINSLYYSFIVRIPEFCLGGYIAKLREKIHHRSSLSKKIVTLIYLAFFSLLFLPSFLFSKLVNFHPVFFLILCLFLASFIILYSGIWNRKVNRIFLLIGKMSYALYLVHYPLIEIFRFSPMFQYSQYHYFFRFLSLLLIGLFGLVLHYFVEEKFRYSSSIALAKNCKKVFKFQFFPLFVVISLLIFLSSHNYFGLNPNPLKPISTPVRLFGCLIDDAKSPCIYSTENSNGESLLIGDSHARMIGQEFVKVMKKNSIDTGIFSKSGCQFVLPKYLDIIENEKFNQEFRKRTRNGLSCEQHNLKILNLAKENHFEYIFVSQRSTSMVEGDFNLDLNAYRTAILNSLEELSIFTKVVLILPTPEFPDSVYFFSGNLLLWQKPYIASRSFPQKEMIANSFADENWFVKKLVYKPQIFFLRTSDLYCKSFLCSRWNGAWLYSDFDHLSLKGSKFLGSRIDHFLFMKY